MIRKAEKQDAQAVYELMCELEQEQLNKEVFMTFYHTNITSPRYHYLVMEKQQSVVCFGSLFVHHPLHHSGLIGEIEELCVKDKVQGQHLGSAMFDAIKQTAKEIGCIQIELSCHLKRTQAHAFYLKQGMKQEHKKFTYRLEETE